MKLTTVVKAPVLDMYAMDWEFEGKNGTTNYVVIYDYDNHISEKLVLTLIIQLCLISFRISHFSMNISLLLYLMKLTARLKKSLQELKNLESNELIESIYFICGSILVVELIKFSIDYLIKPLVNWISSLFPEDWGSTK